MQQQVLFVFLVDYFRLCYSTKCVPINLENKHFRNPFNFTYIHCTLGKKVETFADPIPTTITLKPQNNTQFAIAMPACKKYDFKVIRGCQIDFQVVNINHDGQQIWRKRRKRETLPAHLGMTVTERGMVFPKEKIFARCNFSFRRNV